MAVSNYTLEYDSELKLSKWVGYPDPNYSWEGERLVWERIVKDEDGKDVTVKTYKDPIEIIADFKPASKVYGVEGNIERNAVKKFGGALKGFVWLDKVSGGGEVILPFMAKHIFIATGDRFNPELTEISTDPNSDNWYEVVKEDIKGELIETGKTRVVVKSFSGIGSAAGKPPELIAHYKFNENTVGDNAELVTNGNFSAWTGDNPDGWSRAGETSPSSHTIDGVNTTAETFTISGEGDLSTWFKDGNIFEVTGSTGNNGQWTVQSTSWSSPNFVITVVGNITDATADGTITPHPDPDISQVGTGEGHGGAGTGMCNIYTSDNTGTWIFQSVPIVIGRRYQISIKINKRISGSLYIWDNVEEQWPSKTISSEETHTWTYVATHTTVGVVISKSGVTNLTFDDVSIKLCAVEDSSGNDHDGLAQQDTSAISVAGKINTAFDFNGSSDFIRISHADSFNPTSIISISLWVYPHTYTQYDVIFSKCNSGGAGWRLWSRDISNYKFYWEVKSLSYINSNALIQFNQWQHIVLVKNATKAFIYINGELDNSGLLDDLDETTNDVIIGAMPLFLAPFVQRFFNGLIDNVMFFSRELDRHDVNFLWNGGRGREDWVGLVDRRFRSRSRIR